MISIEGWNNSWAPILSKFLKGHRRHFFADDRKCDKFSGHWECKKETGSFPFAFHPACWKQVVSGSLNIILYAEDMTLTLADWFLPHYNALEQHQDIVLSKFGKQKLPSPKTVILFASI